MRIVLGALWLIDAVLQAQPALFRPDCWRDDLAQSAMGQPAGLNQSIVWAAGLIAHHAGVYNGLFVAIEAAIGLALVLGRFERTAIALSIPWAVGIWWVGEGFGGLPSGFALLAGGAPGAVLLYVLLGLIAWPPSGRAGPVGEAAGGDGDMWPAGAAGGAGVAERPVGGRVRDAGVAERPAVAAWVVLWAGQALLHLPWVFPPAQVLTANVEEHAVGQPALADAPGDMERKRTACPRPAGDGRPRRGRGADWRRRARAGPATRRPALAAGIVVSVIYWAAVQDFGGILGGGATDPGAAPLVIVLALSLWPRRRPAPARTPRLAVASDMRLRAWWPGMPHWADDPR